MVVNQIGDMLKAKILLVDPFFMSVNRFVPY